MANRFSRDEAHITMVTVIMNRKEQNVQTFLSFVDFAKAFDSMNRDCLYCGTTRILEVMAKSTIF